MTKGRILSSFHMHNAAYCWVILTVLSHTDNSSLFKVTGVDGWKLNDVGMGSDLRRHTWN